MTTAHHAAAASFELRFSSLFDPGRSFSFPCNAQGTVWMADLPLPQRQSLMRVVQLVGREFAAPVVAPAH